MEVIFQFSRSRNREYDVQNVINDVLIFTRCVYILADYAAKLEELEKSLVSRPVMASGYESSDMPDMADVSSPVDGNRSVADPGFSPSWGSANLLLPPANEVCEGYVFTGVCLSIGGGSRSLSRGPVQ